MTERPPGLDTLAVPAGRPTAGPAGTGPTTARPATTGPAGAPALPPLVWLRAVDHPELMAPTTHATLVGWASADPAVADAVAVATIDPDLADTAALAAAYDLPLGTSANCVVVSGRRAGEERVAAAVVLATTRADVNSAIKRLLDVRKASFLPTDRATAESAMEYGGITPLGLPDDWRILVDSRVVAAGARRSDGSPAPAVDAAAGTPGHPAVIIGSGIRGSKISLPGEILGRLPRAEVVTDLAVG